MACGTGRGRINSVLVKPAGPDCPLDCSYCFYLEKERLWPEQRRHRMSPKTLDILISSLFREGNDGLSIAWQGGEPGLMGLDFYKKAVELQIQYGKGKSVSNGFQTNGAYLDREWARFFKRYHFLVGLSLDGPAHVHDHHRRTKGGQGTWQKTDAVARMLLAEGVDVNAMATVNSHSVQFLDETYAYLKGLGFTHLQFIPILETDRSDPGRAAAFSVDPEAYGAFLCRLFDLWLSDFKHGYPTTSIRFFESLFYTYVGQEPPDCTLMETCGPYLVVEHDGSLYSCDFFVEEGHRVGSLYEEGLQAAFDSARHQRFGAVKAELDAECSACPWLRHCRGGCPKDRIRDPRDGGHFHFCASHKALFEHADSRMRTLAEEWHKRRAPKETRDT